VTEVSTNFHPEFGYFSATPRLRREWRVALAAFACGATLGALAIVGVSVSYRESDNAFGPSVATEVAARPQILSKEPQRPVKPQPETIARGNSAGESSETRQIAFSAAPPAQTAEAHAAPYSLTPVPERETAALKPTRGTDLLPKSRPPAEAGSPARKAESAPKVADSAYARSALHRRTVFWDWSR